MTFLSFDSVLNYPTYFNILKNNLTKTLKYNQKIQIIHNTNNLYNIFFTYLLIFRIQIKFEYFYNKTERIYMIDIYLI